MASRVGSVICAAIALFFLYRYFDPGSAAQSGGMTVANITGAAGLGAIVFGVAAAVLWLRSTPEASSVRPGDSPWSPNTAMQPSEARLTPGARQPVSEGVPRPPSDPPRMEVCFGPAGNDAAGGAVKKARKVAERVVRDGWVVVEAVWLDRTHSYLGIAMGPPGISYRRLWPSGDDVKDVLFPARPVGPVPVSPTPPRTVAAPSAPSTMPPAEVTAATIATPVPPVPTSLTAPDVTGEPTTAATKVCPDCAETVLGPARICRFCRYEFWAADAGPK